MTRPLPVPGLAVRGGRHLLSGRRLIQNFRIPVGQPRRLRQVKEFSLLAIGCRDHLQVVAARDCGIERRIDFFRVGMEGEFVQRDVARISARRVGICRQPVDHGTVRKAGLKLLDRRPFKEARLEGLGDDSERLDVLLDLLHQEPRLSFSLGQQDPGCLPFQAFENSANCRGKGETDLSSFHNDFQGRVVCYPATLVREQVQHGAHRCLDIDLPCRSGIGRARVSGRPLRLGAIHLGIRVALLPFRDVHFSCFHCRVFPDF